MHTLDVRSKKIVFYRIVSRISLVRPDRAAQVENSLIKMATSRQLSGKITEKQLIQMLEQFSEQTKPKTKITVLYSASLLTIYRFKGRRTVFSMTTTKIFSIAIAIKAFLNIYRQESCARLFTIYPSHRFVANHHVSMDLSFVRLVFVRRV